MKVFFLVFLVDVINRLSHSVIWILVFRIRLEMNSILFCVDRCNGHNPDCEMRISVCVVDESVGGKCAILMMKVMGLG